MNKLLIALTLATTTLVGCSNSKPVEETNPTPAKVELSAAKIACFKVVQTIQQNSVKDGLPSDEYVEDHCGTDVEREAFKSGNYVKK